MCKLWGFRCLWSDSRVRTPKIFRDWQWLDGLSESTRRKASAEGLHGVQGKILNESRSWGHTGGQWRLEKFQPLPGTVKVSKIFLNLWENLSKLSNYQNWSPPLLKYQISIKNSKPQHPTCGCLTGCSNTQEGCCLEMRPLPVHWFDVQLYLGHPTSCPCNAAGL